MILNHERFSLFFLRDSVPLWLRRLSFKDVLPYFTAVLMIIPCIFLFVYPAFADDCEILRADMYQKSQDVIVTDWKDGIPYRKYTTETYRCADMTFRNNFWQAVYSTDIEVTASFSDGNTESKKVTCGKKRLEPFEIFSCNICFDTGSPVSGLVCAFR